MESIVIFICLTYLKLIYLDGHSRRTFRTINQAQTTFILARFILLYYANVQPAVYPSKLHPAVILLLIAYVLCMCCAIKMLPFHRNNYKVNFTMCSAVSNKYILFWSMNKIYVTLYIFIILKAHITVISYAIFFLFIFRAYKY